MAAIPYWVVLYVGQQSAQRGYTYFREGKVELHGVSNHQGIAVDETTIVVRGLVHGTVPTPYQAWASIAGDKITDAHCSCPVGGIGKCKHIAALILAAQAGPEQSNAKAHLVTAPAAANGLSQASPSRQLWSGPFTSTLGQQASPSNQFRSQISPKKSVWSNSLANPPGAAVPFSVQPGFSLKETSNVCAHRDPFEQASSQPSSPFKAKHSVQHEQRVSLYPIPLSQGDTSTNASPLIAPQLSQGDSDQSMVLDVPEAPPNSPFVGSSPTPAPAAEGLLIASLQEELHVSRQFQNNLSKQCDLLREQVRFLELQVSRRDAEIAALQSAKATSSAPSFTRQAPSEAMEVDAKPAMANISPKTVQSTFHPQHVHPPNSKPSEETRDSIEETISEDGVVKSTSTSTNGNTKKRTREYDPIDKPGLSKRLSFEMSATNTNISHPNPAPTDRNVQLDQIPAQQGPPPQLLCDIDSQALMDAMDQFEASEIASKDENGKFHGLTEPSVMTLGTNTSSSTTEQNFSVSSNFTSSGHRRTSACPSPTSSQISTSNSETNGSKPPSPQRSLRHPHAASLQTQQEDDNPSFMLTSAR